MQAVDHSTKGFSLVFANVIPLSRELKYLKAIIMYNNYLFIFVLIIIYYVHYNIAFHVQREVYLFVDCVPPFFINLLSNWLVQLSS